jgi:hypothetical protein
LIVWVVRCVISWTCRDLVVREIGLRSLADHQPVPLTDLGLLLAADHSLCPRAVTTQPSKSERRPVVALPLVP